MPSGPVPAVEPPEVAAASPAEAGEDDDSAFEDDYCDVDVSSFEYDFESLSDELPASPAPAVNLPPASGLAAEWLALFPRLGLSGMAGNIAANCTLVEMQGDDWLLHLDPSQCALFNPAQQRRLNEALDAALGRSLRLRIELQVPQQETPAQAAARQRQERQSQAEDSIHGDPLVQQLIAQFGASVRADSIEPLSD